MYVCLYYDSFIEKLLKSCLLHSQLLLHPFNNNGKELFHWPLLLHLRHHVASSCSWPEWIAILVWDGHKTQLNVGGHLVQVAHHKLIRSSDKHCLDSWGYSDLSANPLYKSLFDSAVISTSLQPEHFMLKPTDPLWHPGPFTLSVNFVLKLVPSVQLTLLKTRLLLYQQKSSSGLSGALLSSLLTDLRELVI